jgi:hypothetical protein
MLSGLAVKKMVKSVGFLGKDRGINQAGLIVFATFIPVLCTACSSFYTQNINHLLIVFNLLGVGLYKLSPGFILIKNELRKD